MKTQFIDGKPYFQRWLLPQNNVNKSAAYHKRPVGNSPEFMPLDNSLNNGIKSCHVNHCLVTSHLKKDDDRKVSMKTPLLIDKGIQTIWNDPEGPPTSARIIHDIDLA